MPLHPIFKSIAIIAYCFIMLNGWMIGIPFLLFLIFSLFEFGTLAQLAALLSFVGFFLLFFPSDFKTIKKTMRLHFVIYILLLSPIVERLISVPLELFNYSTFIIPVLIFVIGFPVYILFLFKYLQKQKGSSEDAEASEL
jgi:hypothetical protein